MLQKSKKKQKQESKQQENRHESGRSLYGEYGHRVYVDMGPSGCRRRQYVVIRG